MPYIRKAERLPIDRVLGCLDPIKPEDIGNLNYIITMLCKSYILCNGEKYKHYNDLIGVLESAKLELYRQKISKYEDVKIIENGEV